MSIYVVEYGRGIITPLKVDPKIKQVEELQEITALHPLGLPDQGQAEKRKPSFSYHPSPQDKNQGPPSQGTSAAARSLADQPAKDFMSAPLLMGKDLWTVAESLTFLQQHNISHLPVSDGNQIIGLLEECDLLRATHQNENTPLAQLKGSFVVISAENSLDRAAMAMLYKNVNAVLIRNDEFKVVGILTTVDFLKIFTRTDLETWA